MSKINPELSKKFLHEIKNCEEKLVQIDGIQIQTRKNVFPPQSKFSHSSIELHHVFGDVKGKTVLDIGTGTGIQAIRVAKMGAKLVIASDISGEAINCANENIRNNGAENIVRVIKSDLFDSVPNEKFDLIIANLPITDFPIYGVVESSLYDPNYQLHKRFLGQAKHHLTNNGFIVMTHINFKGENDFKDFERMLEKYEYSIFGHEEIKAIGYRWRYYRIQV